MDSFSSWFFIFYPVVFPLIVILVLVLVLAPGLGLEIPGLGLGLGLDTCGLGLALVLGDMVLITSLLRSSGRLQSEIHRPHSPSRRQHWSSTDL